MEDVRNDILPLCFASFARRNLVVVVLQFAWLLICSCCPDMYTFNHSLQHSDCKKYVSDDNITQFRFNVTTITTTYPTEINTWVVCNFFFCNSNLIVLTNNHDK